MFKNINRHKCCCCISLKCGLNLIGTFIFLEMITFIVLTWADLEIPIIHPISEKSKASRNNRDVRYSYLFKIPVSVAQLFMIPSLIIFIKWWLKDTLYNRILIKRACLFAMITHTITFVVTIIWNSIVVTWQKTWRREDGHSFVNLSYILFSLLVYLYSMAIAHRFVLQKLYELQKQFNQDHSDGSVRSQTFTLSTFNDTVNNPHHLFTWNYKLP